MRIAALFPILAAIAPFARASQIAPVIEIDTTARSITIPAVEGGADVAVSLTDRRITTPDSATTIASQLLLQSDLRGHVEDAAWYLRADPAVAAPAADALMLTQGWTRYDIPAVIAGNITDSLGYYVERDPALSAVITTGGDKPLSGAIASIMVPGSLFGETAATDYEGRFTVSDLEWPDSTVFVIAARNAKGSRVKNFTVSADDFPAITAFPQPGPTALSSDTVPDVAPSRVHMSPQGMFVTLGEITVTEFKKVKPKNFLDMLSSRIIAPGDRKDIRTYADALRFIPEVTVINESYLYRQDPIEIWINERLIGKSPDFYNVATEVNVESTSEDLENAWLEGVGTEELTLSDLEQRYPFPAIESIAYIPPQRATIFSRNPGGVLHITMSKDPDAIMRTDMPRTLSSTLGAIMPLGFQEPREFYVPPTFFSADNPDPRGATILWLPVVNLSEPLTIPHPTSGYPADVSVTLEGLTPSGSIISSPR